MCQKSSSLQHPQTSQYHTCFNQSFCTSERMPNANRSYRAHPECGISSSTGTLHYPPNGGDRGARRPRHGDDTTYAVVSGTPLHTVHSAAPQSELLHPRVDSHHQYSTSLPHPPAVVCYGYVIFNAASLLAASPPLSCLLTANCLLPQLSTITGRCRKTPRGPPHTCLAMPRAPLHAAQSRLEDPDSESHLSVRECRWILM